MTKDQLYADYARYHRDHRNRATHAVGIPLIVVGLLGIFHACPVRIGPVDLAIAVAVAVLLYYVTLDVRDALISLVVFAALYALAVHLSWEESAGAFILGWGFQLVGHRLEGNKPKFLENLVYLLIGPLYFFQELFDALTFSKRTT